MIKRLSIQSFKSIESVELELGQVNVFIGANGSGKSNLLEAVGVLAAAAFGRVDSESLVRRGVRPGGFFAPLFQDCALDAETSLTADGKDAGYSTSLASPPTGREVGWEFRREVWTEKGIELLNRHATGQLASGDPQAGLAALRLAETDVKGAGAVFLKTLAGYNIYAPDTQILRGLMPDPQVREPVGLLGGRLAEAMGELQQNPETIHKIADHIDTAIPWFAGFALMKFGTASTEKQNFPTQKPSLAFMDKFFRTDGNHLRLLAAAEVNEGLLYVLFLAVLCLHASAPRFLAIDNGDHSLNPLLAKRVINAMCEWILKAPEPRQILMTTHNPLVLDGLQLQDDRVRLFTVDRDNLGKTQVRRFTISDKHRDMAKKGWTLSRMWVNKLIGGMPDV
jgi:predicted ATPase